MLKDNQGQGNWNIVIDALTKETINNQNKIIMQNKINSEQQPVVSNNKPTIPESITSIANTSVNALASLGNTTSKTMDNISTSASNTLGNISTSASKTIDNISTSASNAFDDVSMKTQQQAAQTTSNIQNGITSMGDKLGEATSQLSNTITGFGEGIQEITSDIMPESNPTNDQEGSKVIKLNTD